MAARLIAESGPLAGSIIALEDGSQWTLGRDPDLSDIVLEDSTVSREHVRIRESTGGLLVENLSSTNPALLNGEPLAVPHILEEADQLHIGESLLQFTRLSAEIPLAAPPEEEPPEELWDLNENLEEEEHYETLFEPMGAELPPRVEVSEEDLGRWLLKVVSGPNSGAELSLESGRSYLIGTDAGTCDIVLYDLSVSRQHARILVSDNEQVSIEDLHSRNGVLVNNEKIERQAELSGNAMIALGTTHFILIDREGAHETIISAIPTPVREAFTPLQEEELESGIGESLAMPPPLSSEQVAGRPRRSHVLSGGMLFALIAAASLVLVIVVATLTLFRSNSIEMPKEDYQKQISQALSDFSAVRFNYTPGTGNLLLVGHVLTPVDKSELMYNLQALPFVRKVDDQVVVDQYVWQETNQILAKNPDWKGVNMHASSPGVFVINGYLQTRADATSLQDYLLLSFPYVNQLTNQVVVEEILLDDIKSTLANAGIYTVTPQLSNGELTLTGYVNESQEKTLESVIAQLQKTPGIRIIRNFVVEVAAQEAMINLTGKYTVSGYSTHDNVTVNVLINGQILSRGDTLDGMTITGLQSNAIYLEKDGVKYKIEYSQ